MSGTPCVEEALHATSPSREAAHPSLPLPDPSVAPSALCELLVQQQRRIGALQDALGEAMRWLALPEFAGTRSRRTSAPVPGEDAQRMVALLNEQCASLHRLWDGGVALPSLAPVAETGAKAKDAALLTRAMELAEAQARPLVSSTASQESERSVQIQPVIMLDVTSMFSCRSRQPSAPPPVCCTNHETDVALRDDTEKEERETAVVASAALTATQEELAQMHSVADELRRQMRAQAAALQELQAKYTDATARLESVWEEVEMRQQRAASERADKDKELERLRILMRFSELKKDSDLLPGVAHQWSEAERERRQLRRENHQLGERLAELTRCLRVVATACRSVATPAKDPATRQVLEYINCLCEDAVQGSSGCCTSADTPDGAHPVEHGEGQGEGKPHPRRADSTGTRPPARTCAGSAHAVSSTLGRHQPLSAPSPLWAGGDDGGGHVSSAASSLQVDTSGEAVVPTPLSRDQLSRVRRVLMDARRASAATSEAIARHGGSRGSVDEQLALRRRDDCAAQASRRASRQRPSSSLLLSTGSAGVCASAIGLSTTVRRGHSSFRH